MSKHPPMPSIPSLASHWIHGKPVAVAQARTQEVFNPATGQASRKVELASAETVATAVASAKSAFAAWADTPPLRRSRIMNNFLALLNARKDELASIITQEHGKVFTDAQGEVMWSVRVGRGSIQGGVHFGMAASAETLYAPINDMNDTHNGDVLDAGAARPGIHAVDIATGKVRWSHAIMDLTDMWI